MDLVPDREGSVKGARFWRGLRTLDGSLAVPTIRSEGKGPGVSGGVSDVMLMYLLNERNQLG